MLTGFLHLLAFPSRTARFVMIPQTPPKQIQPPGVFAHHRATVTTHYAVMPPEGILESRIPGIDHTTIQIQASPDLGARFAQILLTLHAGGGMTGPRRDGAQAFFYVVSGHAAIEIDGQPHDLPAGGYAYVPADVALRLTNAGQEDARVIWIKKPYERWVLLPIASVPSRSPHLCYSYALPKVQAVIYICAGPITLPSIFCALSRVATFPWWKPM